MKLPHLPKSEHKWLSEFFSDHNALSWHELVDGRGREEWTASVSPWLNLISLGDANTPIVLPLFDNRGAKTWYACAQNARAAEQLREELNSFLGPSYTMFAAQFHTINPADTVERALHGRFGRWIYQFSAVREEYALQVGRLLQIYAGLLLRRPTVQDKRIRPVGRIRADFDRAILAGDESQAYELLEELRQTGRFDAENQKFIEVRLLAGLGLWETIAHNHPLISTLADLSLPPQTLIDVVEALYRVHAQSWEERHDMEGAVRGFRQVAFRYPRLFHARRGIRRSRILKAFLLFELCQPKPNRILCTAIARDFPREESDPTFFDALPVDLNCTVPAPNLPGLRLLPR